MQKKNESKTLDYKKIWEKGYGVIKHKPETRKNISKMLNFLAKKQNINNKDDLYKILIAADKIANATMWLTISQTYAQNIYLDGRSLKADDFKNDPQGHLGGSLNMVPAYIGYILVNALTNITRAWVMEQGHAVSAIDSANLILNNMNKEHAKRYNLSDQGLSNFARDFYSYKLNKEGKQDSPIGSHVNPHTAGGHLEGGYLGFAGLQYVHMPLKKERLVAFLSDGAFEEQRGSDWTSRWWRKEDSGLIAPIMIFNGRRIDGRSTLAQEGGAKWFKEFLELHDFEPMIFDGRDPAAFAYCIFKQELMLQKNAKNITQKTNYKIKIPYGIAVAPKGAGFYNEGTNYAHNLPLVHNPKNDKIAAQQFNKYTKKLFVTKDEIKESLKYLNNHKKSGRILEKDNPIANRNVILKNIPKINFLSPKADLNISELIDEVKPQKELGAPELFPQRTYKYVRTKSEEQRKPVLNLIQDQFLKLNEYISPMDAIDDGFLSIAKENNHLRARVGNPDEILSNRMDDTLKDFDFRVVTKEKGNKESILGKVITALNEEAVAAAAFGNKGGINIIVTYEAFASKMFGGSRQEIIFAKHKKGIGNPAKWLSVPIILTSNTWENSKNELSHQDPSFSENMLSESADISRVIFPADFNSAAVTINKVYQTQGQIWSIVIPKNKTPLIFNQEESLSLLKNGAIRLTKYEHDSKNAKIAIIAIGAYQLIEALKAADRLKEQNIAFVLSYIVEPGRFRFARNEYELEHLANKEVFKDIVPDYINKILIISHTRAELMLGVLAPLWQNKQVRALGFINEGGTLSIKAMLFVNKQSFVHIIKNVEDLTLLKKSILTKLELDALNGKISPDNIIT